MPGPRLSKDFTPVAGCFLCESLQTRLSVLFQSKYWVAQAAVEQGYMGHTFLTLLEHKPSLSSLTPAQWNDLHESINRFEQAFTSVFGADVFNWVCLMNDAFKSPDPKPHVHWKVSPRYARKIELAGQIYQDPNFGHHYDKSHDSDNLAPMGSGLRVALESKLKGHF